MEKIIINSVEAKFGKPNAQGVCTPFWAVKLGDGRKATIWDEGLGKTAMENLNKELEAEIKTTPAGYSNIRAINIATSADKPMALGMSDTHMPPMKPSRENSIVAQVFVKCANLQLIQALDKSPAMSKEDAGMILCEAVTELHGAYKVALDRLDE